MRSVPVPQPLPAVGRLINQAPYQALAARYPRAVVVEAIRQQLERERAAGAATADEARLAAVEAGLAALAAPHLRRVINATGVVLHTNLGRAPLSRGAQAALARVAAGYSNLELDLESGNRGARSAGVAGLLRRLTGAEDGLAVNNNAAAVLLALAAHCRGRQVIVSRGELVEIGGGFRMPDVMRQAGAKLIEVGTTNRTRTADYEGAIGDRTAAILRVHRSNFRITGFAETPALEELSRLARTAGILLIDDLGSGALQPVADEPTVAASVAAADLVAFSGDKLLGGPQAGILVGKEDAVRRCARHPLARAVRADKLTLAALEGTLADRLLRGPGAIPVDRMLTEEEASLRRRAAWWTVKLADRDVGARVVEAPGQAGGGSLPGVELPSLVVCLDAPAARMVRALRNGDPPVIARVHGGRCCLDPRTVLPGEDETLFAAVERAVKSL